MKLPLLNTILSRIIARKFIAGLAGGIFAVVGGIASFAELYQYYEASNQANIAGKWSFLLTVDESDYKPYIGMQIRYDMLIHQNADQVSLDGEKVELNGAPLSPSQRARINAVGQIIQSAVHMQHTLYGEKRDTIGTFDLTISDPYSMRGRFDSSGANSQGTVEASKIR
jgi:hypothetical protein